MKRQQIYLLICLMSLKTFSQTKNFIDQPYIDTSIEIDTLVKPNLIFLDIFISEKDTRNKISLEELENKMASKLTSLGIDIKEQLNLKDLASNFKTYFFKKKNIMKSKQYTLKLFDAVSAGKVIGAMEEIGISNINLDKVEYSEVESLKLALKIKAIITAKKQAEALTKALNQKVGKAIYITDSFQNSNKNYNENLLEEVIVTSYRKKGFAPIEIDFKKIKFTSRVSVKFKIE